MTEQKQHLVALDGLRGVAAISVVVMHGNTWTGQPLLTDAYLAVDFFFMLSGFVIDHAYRRRLAGSMSFVQFVRVRVIRLYPLIIAGVMVGAGALLVQSYCFGNVSPETFLAVPFNVAGLPAPLEPDRFPLNPPEWSLFFELVANFAFGAVLFRLSTRRLGVVTACLAIAYGLMAWKTGTVLHGNYADQWSWGFVRVAFPFSMGMLLNRARPMRLTAPFWLSSVIVFASFASPNLSSKQWMYELVVVAAIYPAVIFFGQSAKPNRWCRRLASTSGFISYPLYMLHWPLCALAATALNVKTAFPAKWWPLIVLIVVLASWVAGILDERLRRMLTRVTAAPSTHPLLTRSA